MLNFNLVGPIASLFYKVEKGEGESPDATYIKDKIKEFIDTFGIDQFVQVVMDNCTTNVNANGLIEEECVAVSECLGRVPRRY